MAPQYEGKTSDLISTRKKLVKEHPQVGSEGHMVIYTGGCLKERAAHVDPIRLECGYQERFEFFNFLVLNGKTIFDNQR